MWEREFIGWSDGRSNLKLCIGRVNSNEVRKNVKNQWFTTWEKESIMKNSVIWKGTGYVSD